MSEEICVNCWEEIEQWDKITEVEWWKSHKECQEVVDWTIKSMEELIEK